MSYRALRISRNDKTPIEGFEQDDYVRNSSLGRRPLADLIARVTGAEAGIVTSGASSRLRRRFDVLRAPPPPTVQCRPSCEFLVSCTAFAVWTFESSWRLPPVKWSQLVVYLNRLVPRSSSTGVNDCPQFDLTMRSFKSNCEKRCSWVAGWRLGRLWACGGRSHIKGPGCNRSPEADRTPQEFAIPKRGPTLQSR